MAMATWYQAIDAEALAALRAEPDGIGRLDAPPERTAMTYLQTSLCWFCAGDADPDPEDGPVAAALAGGERVDTDVLENGAFHVVAPAQVAAGAVALGAIDRASLRARVREADLDALVEVEELYDIEPFVVGTDTDLGDGVDIGPEIGESVAEMLVSDLEALTAFFSRAAEAGLAVVSYTA